MVQLIILTLGIALASYVVMAGVSYLDLDGIKTKEYEASWSTVNLGIAQAWVDTNRQLRRDPHDAEELRQAASRITIVPQGFELTELPSNVSGWCIAGLGTQSDIEALKNLAKRFPRSYGISSTCGYTNGVDPTWLNTSPAQYPRPVTITYIISQQ